MQLSYYERNVEYIRNRNKQANKEYYRQNRSAILLKRRYRYMASKRVKASYFDLLPCDIQLQIFQRKHELEFRPTLEIINKLKYAVNPLHHNVFCDMTLNRASSPVCDIHLRNGLLTPISTKSSILIDLRCFSSNCYFYTSCQTIQLINKMLNADLVMTYRNKHSGLHAEAYNARFKYDCVSIKFNQKRKPVLVIEIIELLRLLGLRYDDPDPNTIGRLLIYDIGVHYRTRQRDIISIGAFTD